MTTPAERPVVSLRTGYMQELNKSPSALYRLYDSEDRLMYLGITMNPKRRFQQHGADKFWWHLVVRHEIEWHANRVLAAEAEHAAILSEKPVHDASYRFATGLKYAYVNPPSDPYWRPLAQLIYHEIEAGIYPPGEDLPRPTKMAAKYRVSRASVERALSRLIECRMVESRLPAGSCRVYTACPSPDRRPVESVWGPTIGEAREFRERTRRAASFR
jgi:predicted GIY-YIG superfamily endonuclease